MKKLTAVFFALLIMFSIFAITSSAAEPAINANEKKILDAISQEVTLGNGKYKIPDEYVAQAKNYFLTSDITDKQATEAITYIDEGIAVIKCVAPSTGNLNIKALPQATKNKLLKSAQDACATANCKLVYSVSNEKIVITTTPAGSTTPVVVFNSEPIIKKTGSDFDCTAIVLTVSALALALAAVVVTSKKVKLF